MQTNVIELLLWFSSNSVKNAEKYAKKVRRFPEKNCARWRGKTNPTMMVLTLPSNKMMIIEQKVQQAEENEKFGCWPNQFTL